MQTSPAERSHWAGSTSSTSDPRSCPVVAGRETTIEICKGNLGLGLSIVGGCDTLDDTGIFVSEIIRGGVAESDGSLLHGDQILSINREDVRAASQEHAQRLLQVSLINHHKTRQMFSFIFLCVILISFLLLCLIRCFTFISGVHWGSPPGSSSF
uniref:PDZ domain-containing protein n=1 Tax=Fundulus heteroclitus TaxID=8078 RepID=A0A3Q2NWL7_FUNHE